MAMKRKSARRTRTDAFTFVEVLVAVTLLVIGFLGVYSSMHASALLRETSHETNIAVFKLQTTVEHIFSLPFDDVTLKLPAGVPVDIAALIDADPQNNFRLNGEQIVANYNFPVPDLMQFTVTITWTSRMGTQRTETLASARAR